MRRCSSRHASSTAVATHCRLPQPGATALLSSSPGAHLWRQLLHQPLQHQTHWRGGKQQCRPSLNRSSHSQGFHQRCWNPRQHRWLAMCRQQRWPAQPPHGPHSWPAGACRHTAGDQSSQAGGEADSGAPQCTHTDIAAWVLRSQDCPAHLPPLPQSLSPVAASSLMAAVNALAMLAVISR